MSWNKNAFLIILFTREKVVWIQRFCLYKSQILHQRTQKKIYFNKIYKQVFIQITFKIKFPFKYANQQSTFLNSQSHQQYQFLIRLTF